MTIRLSALLFAFILGTSDALSQIPGHVLSYTKISASATSLGSQSYWRTLGNSVVQINDIDGDGIMELAAGNTFDGKNYIYIIRMNADGSPKPAYTVIGADTGGLVNYQPTNFGTFGYGAIANMGDLNGNGVDDLALGNFNGNEYFILFLNNLGKVDSFRQIGPARGNFPVVNPATTQLGLGLANIGDLDHDGVNDLAVTDNNYNGKRGAVWVIFMKPNGNVKDYKLIASNTAGFNYTIAANDAFGKDVAGIGDLDKDGVPDMMVTANQMSSGQKGDVFTLFMNSDGTVKSFYHYVPGTSTLPDTMTSGGYFGETITTIGDIDGDSVVDVAIGEAGFLDSLGTRYGRVHIWMLNADASIKSRTYIDKYRGNFTAPLRTGDLFGVSVATAGDVNGDGKKDLIVGAQYDDDANLASNNRNSGAIYFLHLDGIGSPPVQNAVGDLIYNRTSSYYAYPNPTSDKLIIRPRDKDITIDRVELFDLAGKKLQTVAVSNATATLQVSELNPGTYLVSVTDKNGTQTIQFVKR